jgi:hypothetical protein
MNIQTTACPAGKENLFVARWKGLVEGCYDNGVATGKTPYVVTMTDFN